jgi:chromosome segregation ATPase
MAISSSTTGDVPMESSDDLTNELPGSNSSEPDDLRSRVERLERLADERARETAPLRSVLEEIRLEMRQQFGAIRTEVDVLRGEVTGVRGELGVLRSEVTGLRGELGVLRSEVTELRGEVGVLRGEVAELRGEVGVLRSEVTELRTEMRRSLADSTRNITQVTRSGFTQVNFEMALMSTRVSDLEARVTKIEESRPQQST